jgi:hypothetical protein
MVGLNAAQRQDVYASCPGVDNNCKMGAYFTFGELVISKPAEL